MEEFRSLPDTVLTGQALLLLLPFCDDNEADPRGARRARTDGDKDMRTKIQYSTVQYRHTRLRAIIIVSHYFGIIPETRIALVPRVE